jgi:hypothetical protein
VAQPSGAPARSKHPAVAVLGRDTAIIDNPKR